VIENVGIMGQKMVAIYPARQGEPLPPESTVFEGEYQPGIPQLMAELGGTLEAFGRIAKRLDELMANWGEGQYSSVQRTLENMDLVASELAVFMKESRGELSLAVDNFNKSMVDLHAALDGNADEVHGLLANASRASSRLDTTLVNLNEATDQLETVLTRVQNGEGTLGKIMNDENLYDELVDTVGRTRALVEDIRANPKRYVKLSLF
jgi:phospholipid/cholesterol/gamma-HCH transport system substrate-binding protein